VSKTQTKARESQGYAWSQPTCCDPPEKLAREILARGPKQVVLTLGGRGALIVTEFSETHVPSVDVPVVDTTGAGDAFNAGLAVALANGSDVESAVRFTVIAGALAVTKEGVTPSLPYRDDVLASFNRNGFALPQWFRT